MIKGVLLAISIHSLCLGHLFIELVLGLVLLDVVLVALLEVLGKNDIPTETERFVRISCQECIFHSPLGVPYSEFKEVLSHDSSHPVYLH